MGRTDCPLPIQVKNQDHTETWVDNRRITYLAPVYFRAVHIPVDHARQSSGTPLDPWQRIQTAALQG